MEKELFLEYKEVFCRLGRKYKEKYNSRFDEDVIKLDSYNELRDYYKKNSFFNSNSYIDNPTVLAVMTLAFLPKKIIFFNTTKLSIAQRTAKDTIFGMGSVCLLKAKLIKDLTKKFPNKREHIERYKFKIEYAANIIKYLNSLSLKTSITKHIYNSQYIFPLSQVYRAIVLNMEVDFLNKVVIKPNQK